MPGGDRTGPMGMGAMSGRGRGYCSGIDLPGYANAVRGPGAGMGVGMGVGRGGRGWRNQYFATGRPGWMRFGPAGEPGFQADGPTDTAGLKQQAQALQSALDAIKQRLDEME